MKDLRLSIPVPEYKKLTWKNLWKRSYYDYFFKVTEVKIAMELCQTVRECLQNTPDEIYIPPKELPLYSEIGSYLVRSINQSPYDEEQLTKYSLYRSTVQILMEKRNQRVTSFLNPIIGLFVGKTVIEDEIGYVQNDIRIYYAWAKKRRMGTRRIIIEITKEENKALASVLWDLVDYYSSFQDNEIELQRLNTVSGLSRKISREIH